MNAYFLNFITNFKKKISNTKLVHNAHGLHSYLQNFEFSSQNLTEIDDQNIAPKILDGNICKAIDDIYFQKHFAGNHFHPFSRNHAFVLRRS